MRSKREKVTTDRAIAVQQQQHGDETLLLRISNLPDVLRFFLVVLLSFMLSALGYSFVAWYTAGELVSVSRTLDSWWEVAALVGWRSFEVTLGWYASYDSYDLATLSLLSTAPPLYLLYAFYGVRSTTVISSLIIDALASYIPFRLLRPLSPAHAASTSPDSPSVPNRDILTDFSVQIYTTLLAAAIYSVTLYAAFSSYLPLYLVTYFNNIPSISLAHSSTAVSLFPLMLPLGLAAKSFIFTPAAAVAPSKQKRFDPANSTLWETLQWNVCGYRPRTKVVLLRTLMLALVSGGNTFMQTFVTLQGVEPPGAIAYSSVWVAATCITGYAFKVVGDV